MHSRETWAEFLGLRRGIVGLLLIVILIGMGERLAERFLPVYILALGGGTLAIGIFNGLVTLLGALYSFPGGYLAQRLGPRSAMTIFNAMALIGFALVAAVPHWAAVVGGAVLFISWSAISLPATMGLLADALPAAKRTMGVSMHSLVRRIPMALGPIVGGALIGALGMTAGVRVAMCIAAALALIAMFVQRTLLPISGRGPGPTVQPGILAILKRSSPELRNLLISDILIRFCEQIPYAFVAVWCMNLIRSPVSALQFGVLTAVEMATAVLCYIPVARWADRGAKRPFVLATFAFFTLFPVVLLWSQSYEMLLLAFVVRGLKEFGEPTRKALIVDLSPADAREITFGAYYLVRDCIVSIAAFGGCFLWELSPAVNLWTSAAFGALGTFWYAVRGR
jgi:MFS family permease